MNRLHRVSLVALLVLAAGCAQNIVQESAPGSGDSLQVKRVVVVPFRTTPRPGAPAIRPDAAALVGSYVAEAFSARGIDTVPPTDVADSFGDQLPTEVPALVQAMRDRFGADAVVTGRVYRFRERAGQAMGTLQPASVGFEVRVFNSAGKLFRAKVFDHTQVALGENALTAAQYPGRGSRWLTAEELSRWGATEVVRSLPLQ